MNLLEYIEALEPNAYIKVGADKGNGFIYCGKAGDFAEYMTNENISAQEYNKLFNIIRVKEDYIANFNSEWEKEYKSLTKAYKIAKEEGRKEKRFKPFKTITAYRTFLRKDKDRKYKNLEKLLDFYKTRLNEFTPIETREVVETYENVLLNEDGQIDYIIVFKGLEAAPYWDLTEFRHGVQKEDLLGYPQEREGGL